jgi:hypothetical protein
MHVLNLVKRKELATTGQRVSPDVVIYGRTVRRQPRQLLGVKQPRL